MATRGHNGHAWRTVRALVLAPDFLVCWLCRRPIDKSIRWPHPLSKSVDLVIPYSRGGSALDPRNLRPAHLGCNSGRRDRTPEQYRRSCTGQTRATSRRWTSTDDP